MTHDDSPFQSPQATDSTEPIRFFARPYVQLVIAAIICHLVAYPLMLYASSLASQLLVDVGPDPPAWVEPTLHTMQKILLVVVPVTYLLGFTSVFLLWRQWDRHWYGAPLMAFLTLVAGLALAVFAYALWRASRELARHDGG
ncbi:hypothetical protein [Bremerella sp.]|uniref:hypothetical protein n=1 Tax=Bremerella sp. TaxID=2795602 RepID=UPI00391DC515